jgi:anti-sigma-K factor RskA
MLPWLAIALVLIVAIILAAVVSSRKTDEPDVADVAEVDKGSSTNERMPLLSDLEKLDLLR